VIPDGSLKTFVPSLIAADVRAVGEKFYEAESRAEVTQQLGRNYHLALAAYARALHVSPYGPSVNLMQPTEYDSEMKGYVRAELARIQSEFDRIVESVGGLLTFDSDDDE
jgi:hypothetical protein